jgi:hypothetical protein
VNRYCVGPAMAVDWGEDQPELAAADRRRMMARVLAYFRPYWRPGLVVVACIAVQAVLGLAPAVVFKSLIDALAHPHPSFGHVALLVGAGIGAAVAGGLTGVGEAYLSTRISQGIVATLRQQLFGRLLDQPVGFFTDRRAGDLLSRINTDIDGVEDVVTDTVFGLVSSVLVTIATLVLMLRFSWQLTLAVLVMIPVVALPARRAGRATYQPAVHHPGRRHDPRPQRGPARGSGQPRRAAGPRRPVRRSIPPAVPHRTPARSHGRAATSHNHPPAPDRRTAVPGPIGDHRRLTGRSPRRLACRLSA